MASRGAPLQMALEGEVQRHRLQLDAIRHLQPRLVAFRSPRRRSRPCFRGPFVTAWGSMRPAQFGSQQACGRPETKPLPRKSREPGPRLYPLPVGGYLPHGHRSKGHATVLIGTTIAAGRHRHAGASRSSHASASRHHPQHSPADGSARETGVQFYSTIPKGLGHTVREITEVTPTRSAGAGEGAFLLHGGRRLRTVPSRPGPPSWCWPGWRRISASCRPPPV